MVLTLIIMCFILLFNPIEYGQTCLNAISLWSLKVLPLLFPFFVLTKMIVNLTTPKENFMDKFFNKLYRTPKGSCLTFFLSTLSGYPMGAKLICEMYNNKQINSNQAKKMLSFCSVSGPMFMLGTVGIGFLFSAKAGIIILLSNIFASLINGLLYRGKPDIVKDIEFKNRSNHFSLSDCVYDSLISILMVGAYISISFIIIEILKNLEIFNLLTKFICSVFSLHKHQDIVFSVLTGIIEITKGISDLSNTNSSLMVKVVLASGLIGFGGISIMLQSLNFLTNLKISIKTMLKQKFTQCMLCVFISFLLCLIFL